MDKIVGHVPIELSRHIFFAQSRGCSFKGQVKIERPIRSPLAKGGLEIVCLVTASWTWKIGSTILQDFFSSDYSTDRNEEDDPKLILEDIGRKWYS